MMAGGVGVGGQFPRNVLRSTWSDLYVLFAYNKTMQNLPPHVLTTTFRFVEEILSAKLIKVTYFPGSLLMLVITRWEFKSNTLTSWVEQTNKPTNFQQRNLKKGCTTGHNFWKACRFLCIFSFNIMTFE